MDEIIIAKGTFIKNKKTIRKLIQSAIIIILVFSVLSSLCYLVERAAFKSDAEQALYELCCDIENYYYERIDAWNMPKTENSKYELAQHDTELQFENVTIDINGNKYYLGNIGYSFFNSNIGAVYSNSHETPESMMKPVIKKYNSWYLKNGKAIKMMTIGLAISIILLIIALALRHTCRYSKLLVTDKTIYVETRNGEKITIPIGSITSVSTINKGVVFKTSTVTTKIRLIKNNIEIFDAISNLIKNKSA